jgi:superfamily II DNA or RNA helicase
MTALANVLSFIVASGHEPAVRALARAQGISSRVSLERAIEQLVESAGDLDTLMTTLGSRNEWNDLVEALGGERRKSYEDIAAQLTALAAQSSADATDDEFDEDDDADDEFDAFPDDVFEFDRDAASRKARPYQHELTTAIATTFSTARPGSRHRITVATGGGKTRIANDWIAEHAIPAGWRVLWVTKDWPLLRQAASDLCRRRPRIAGKLGYAGCRGNTFLGPLAESAEQNVVYTTIHTWKNRRETDFADTRFDAVIIDEAHWGEGKAAYEILYKRYRNSARFLGLTATPREGTEFDLIGKEYGYTELASMGYLAKHIVEEPVPTGVRWSPTRSFGRGDFDRASLATLARSTKRNRRIVETYTRDRKKFGKTLVFACDVEHADALRKMFQSEGIAAEAVHSAMRAADQAAVVKRFTEGRTLVLVNVAMMTHGIDIPDIETVFLARPTTSKILFAQMIGRATRLTEGKTHFRIVDFVDTLDAHGEVLQSPTEFFGEIDAPRVSRDYPRAALRKKHAFAPSPFELVPRRKGFEEIAGFDVQPEQTFGIEFELTREEFVDGEPPDDWEEVAQALLDAIPDDVKKARSVLHEYHSDEKRHDVWNVEWDSSCGWEVTSRILRGAEGFYEVMDVCRALDAAAARLGLRVDKRTGTHVHLGWEPNLRVLQRLVKIVSHHESALYTLVAPSRAGNKYCQPIRGQMNKLLALGDLDEWAAHFEDRETRYLSVNPRNLFGGYGTLEVRLHSGTLEGPKILGWLSLWMRILAAAEGKKTVPAEEIRLRSLPLEEGPRGDIRTLADRVVASRELSEHLVKRRAAVMERWLENAKYAERAAELMAKWGDA